MRAGLVATGPRLLLKLFSVSRCYGFVLQPTGARPSCKKTPHVPRRAVRAPLGSAPRFAGASACKDTSMQPRPRCTGRRAA